MLFFQAAHRHPIHLFFFLNDPATTEFYPLPLHDALPISLVSLPAPSGSEIVTSGTSSMPTAISSEPPPMSSMSTLPEDQPNHRRTARNVSRASSGPGSTAMSTPVADLTEARTASPLDASR